MHRGYRAPRSLPVLQALKDFGGSFNVGLLVYWFVNCYLLQLLNC